MVSEPWGRGDRCTFGGWALNRFFVHFDPLLDPALTIFLYAKKPLIKYENCTSLWHWECEFRGSLILCPSEQNNNWKFTPVTLDPLGSDLQYQDIVFSPLFEALNTVKISWLFPITFVLLLHAWAYLGILISMIADRVQSLGRLLMTLLSNELT